MHSIEKALKRIRHHPTISGSPGLWNVLRPIYFSGLELVTRNRGLERTINGTDRIRVTPELQGMSEIYEPDLWAHLMASLRKGDFVAEVGAYVGLFSVAIAQRVTSSGKVYAIEPDPDNFSELRSMIAINKAGDRVVAVPVAMGNERGIAWLEPRKSQSEILGSASSTAIEVDVETLDGYFGGESIDILKIDVEGQECNVLLGAAKLLHDHNRGPRLIYMEVHPYAWPSVESTSRSILEQLRGSGYSVKRLGGQTVEAITEYGHIIATR